MPCERGATARLSCKKVCGVLESTWERERERVCVWEREYGYHPSLHETLVFVLLSTSPPSSQGCEKKIVKSFFSFGRNQVDNFWSNKKSAIPKISVNTAQDILRFFVSALVIKRQFWCLVKNLKTLWSDHPRRSKKKKDQNKHNYDSQPLTSDTVRLIHWWDFTSIIFWLLSRAINL